MWTCASESERTSASRRSCPSSEKATITRSIAHASTISARSSGFPRIGICRTGSPRSSRSPVDEADELDAVLGMPTDLPRHELPDVAGARDDRALHVGGATA